MRQSLFILLFFMSFNLMAQEEPVFRVDFSGNSRTFEHYWKSTGFTPAAAIEHPSMQMSLDLLGASSGKAVEYVRPHYLLNLVGTEGLGTGNPRYNWISLDMVIDYLVDNELRPFFEIMGHPSRNWDVDEQSFDAAYQGQESKDNRYFNDFEDTAKVNEFRMMVKAMAEHFIARYGIEEVKKWYFETTNEPNIKYFWEYGMKGYLNYYDACAEGLKAASPALRFGGPGTAGAPDNDYFRMFLAHCDTGHSYTGKKAVVPDFISYHIKARPRFMVENEEQVFNYISSNHPSLKNITLINNEADPVSGWSKYLWWRPGPWYASFIVHSIDLHNRKIIDSLGINYGLLSNDNGFMGNWYRRSHFARFMEDNDNQLSPSEGFYLLKKPVYTVMGLLSRLGEKRFEVNRQGTTEETAGMIPTMDEQGNYIIALYNSPLINITYDQEPTTKMPEEDSLLFLEATKTFRLQISGIEQDTYKLLHYRIDENHGNPYALWKNMGEPEFPSQNQYRRLLSVQEPGLLGTPDDLSITTDVVELEVDMPPASVSLIILARTNDTGLLPPEGLMAKEYPGLNNERVLFLSWKDNDNRNLLSYNVWVKMNKEDDFRKINPQFVRDKGIVYIVPGDAENLEFKVNAIDYWGRESEFSDVIRYSIPLNAGQDDGPQQQEIN